MREIWYASAVNFQIEGGAQRCGHIGPVQLTPVSSHSAHLVRPPLVSQCLGKCCFGLHPNCITPCIAECNQSAVEHCTNAVCMGPTYKRVELFGHIIR